MVHLCGHVWPWPTGCETPRRQPQLQPSHRPFRGSPVTVWCLRASWVWSAFSPSGVCAAALPGAAGGGAAAALVQAQAPGQAPAAGPAVAHGGVSHLLCPAGTWWPVMSVPPGPFKTTGQTPSPDRAPHSPPSPPHGLGSGEDGPVSSGSLVGAEPPAAMEEEEEQPAQETNADPAGASGAAEMVPRVPPGEPQNLCSCSQDHVVLGGRGGPLLVCGRALRPRADADAFHLLLEMKLKRRRERPRLPRTVTELVAEDGSRVYVVGTAHFSDDSKRDVVKTIRAVQPDVVVVELCQYRVSMLKMDERTLLREAKEISLEKLQQAVRQNGVMSGLMQMLLLKVSAHITEQLGMAPGGEFREAFKEASKVPFCKFHLGDRPIPVTFKRAIAALSFWQKVKLAWGLCFLSDPISKDDVERCKQKDLLEQMMAEMIGEFPDLHRTIVSERDVYLTYMLRQAARRLELPRASDAEPRKCVPSVVVGVVGMGHVPGIEKNWTTDLNIQEIMTVPPPSISGRVSRLAVKVTFLGLLGYGLYWMGRRTASLVLSLPAAQYCLQRVSSARPDP